MRRPLEACRNLFELSKGPKLAWVSCLGTHGSGQVFGKHGLPENHREARNRVYLPRSFVSSRKGSHKPDSVRAGKRPANWEDRRAGPPV